MAQAVPQAPQLETSVCISVHAPLQRFGEAAGQLHVPLAHVPPVQVFPQAPQLAVSVFMFTHVVPHKVLGHEGDWAGGHASWHEPSEHLEKPVGHAARQFPW